MEPSPSRILSTLWQYNLKGDQRCIVRDMRSGDQTLNGSEIASPAQVSILPRSLFVITTGQGHTKVLYESLEFFDCQRSQILTATGPSAWWHADTHASGD